MKRYMFLVLLLFMVFPGFSQKFFYSGTEFRYVDFRKTYDAVSIADSITFSFDRDLASIISPGIFIGYGQNIGKHFFISTDLHLYNNFRDYEKLGIFWEFYGKDLNINMGTELDLARDFNVLFYLGMGIVSYKYGVFYNFLNTRDESDYLIIGSKLSVLPRLGAQISYKLGGCSVGLIFNYGLYTDFTFGFYIPGYFYSVGLNIEFGFRSSKAE